MISGKDYAVRFPDGDPTGSFECLGGFIYKQSGKAPSVEQTMVAADQSRSYHTGTVEKIGID